MSIVQKAAGTPVEDFWVWWASSGRAAAEAGIGGGAFGGFTREMTARVEAMHPDLAWELAPGGQAEHALIVTAAGVPGQRRIAERWYQQAPTADPLWEYHPARQASPSSLTAVLDLDGRRLALAELRFDLHVDSDRDVIDTVVYHPAFPKMAYEARGRVGFLALDWALGEDGVTRWIGTFDTSAKRPADGLAAGGLIETVEALARRAGEPRWALMQGKRDGAVVLASLALPAKWVDYPLLDLHIAVALPFAEQTASGLPSPGTLDRLGDFVDRLTGRLPPHIRLLARETTRGIQTIHLYGDSDDPALVGQVRNLVSEWPGATLNASPDAGWRAIRHLTG
jgi:hypothetical protein